MGDTFSPEDRIKNIMFVLESLNTLTCECDSAMMDLYKTQINRTFLDLNEAIADMKTAQS